MKTLKFKTNIKCGGCVAAVTPHLNALEGIAGNWQVDLQNPDRVLTVETGNAGPDKIKDAIQKAGYKAEQV
ncbi:heavy-metal-associated domain-containing protein [Rhodocytophaga rosea]|uniref:Heavy-metal-associated domain-containing protein n=1 Tax=Rhodocytophaga rosea TaxID=2704465 RepID=A0A6C0GKI0_9BACT|nr:heavy-metal-associated domain-containing protein [Rhodocytophaga rosea]QHT68505.1 heavy-metal-associated domain-containing protein [Rhodocytophaga rosea]